MRRIYINKLKDKFLFNRWGKFKKEIIEDCKVENKRKRIIPNGRFLIVTLIEEKNMKNYITKIQNTIIKTKQKNIKNNIIQ